MVELGFQLLYQVQVLKGLEPCDHHLPGFFLVRDLEILIQESFMDAFQRVLTVVEGGVGATTYKIFKVYLA